MKQAGISLRRVGLAMLLLFMTYAPTVFSQSLTLFNFDASAYPVMRAKFFAFDADGNQVSGISPGDLQLREDGIARTITRVSCPPLSSPQVISSVLTIDKSGSMIRHGYIQAAKAAASAWVAALPLGSSECAVTSFNDRAYINQDFSTDRTALLEAINALRAGPGGTDFDAALLNPPAGALEVCKRGHFKKVIVFLSDGEAVMGQQSAIIAEAQRQNATIHAVMLDMQAPQSIRDVCAATGGLLFEHSSTEAELTNAFLRILHAAQGGSPCELEWTSEGCARTRMLEMTLLSPAVKESVLYRIPSALLPHLGYTPSRSLHFGEVTPGTQPRQQVTLTAYGSALHIERVTLNNPHFSILDYGGAAPPFTLDEGQTRTLSVQYAPIDSTYTFCRIEVESEACLGMSFYADGGWREKQVAQMTVRVVHPNGGERLLAGSEAELIWEGVMLEDTVRLEYSIDGGASWKRISNDASGLQYAWRVPKQPSDRCLLRVMADSLPTFLGDMALIPAGSFRMGNITDHPDWGHEKPVHGVTITRPFLISRREVTQDKYESVMGSNPSLDKGPDLPVFKVSWYEAVEFCNKLSQQEGLDTCYSGSGTRIACNFEANGYRLPTEAEWEYACRAGTETDFYTGNMTQSGIYPLDPALDRAGWYGGNSGSSIHTVGEKEPNAFGVYDMHGNVVEWCWDWYSDDYYISSPTNDPRGPASGTERVLRGGSWTSSPGACRSSCRGRCNPSLPYTWPGFRLARKY